MQQDNKDRNNPSQERILPQQHDEDFNTDRDKPSTNVGPGYDDTGMGNDARASLKNEDSDPGCEQAQEKESEESKRLRL